MGQDEIGLIETYFSELNPIAHKINGDIRLAKSNNNDLWNELSQQERNELINSALIKTDLTLRYLSNRSTLDTFPSTTTSSSPLSNDTDLQRIHGRDGESSDGSNKVYAYDGKNLRTFHLQTSAQKLIHDETVGLFRDEHSGPFSYKTKSQLNISSLPNVQQDDAGEASDLVGSLLLKSNHKSAPTKKTVVGPQQKDSPIDHNVIHLKYQAVDENDSKIATAKTISDSITKLGIYRKDDGKAGLFTRFIHEDNYLLNAAIANACQSNTSDDLSLDSGNYDSKGLIVSSNMSQDDSSNSLQSEEDDEKNTYEESTLLLNTTGYDLHKGFEFLSNW